MPGTPGHAATNVIDQQGGLDPRGLTVDGNNAAGVRKGFKLAEAPESVSESILDEPGEYAERLRRLTARRDPDGISTNVWDVSKRENAEKSPADCCESSHSDLPTKTAAQTGCEAPHSDFAQALELFSLSELSQRLNR